MKNLDSITFRIEEDLKQKLQNAANQEHRSLSNLIKLILESWLEEYESGGACSPAPLQK